MKGIKSSKGGIFTRAMGFLLVGLMLNMIFLNPMTTYSWFTSEASTSMHVTAATTENIITDIGVDENVNPKNLLFSGSQDLLDREVIIYFSVDGDINEHILHINPVTVQANKDYSIPIEPNINLIQYISLINLFPWQSDTVKGHLSIKYLNEFIDHKIELTFTKEYLRGIFKEQIQRTNTASINIADNPEAANEIIEATSYLASQIAWENNSSLMALRNLPSTHMGSSVNMLEKNNEAPEIVLQGIPIGKYEFSDEQSKIIKIVSPSLPSYLDELYGAMLDLINSINEKISTIFELEQQVDDLQNTVEDLNIQLQVKLEEIESLQAKNSNLTNQLSSLEHDYGCLINEVIDLRNHECTIVNQPTDPVTEEPVSPEPKTVEPSPSDQEVDDSLAPPTESPPVEVVEDDSVPESTELIEAELDLNEDIDESDPSIEELQPQETDVSSTPHSMNDIVKEENTS